MGQPLSLYLYQNLIGRSEARVTARLKRLLSKGEISEAEHDQRLAHNLPARAKGELLWLHAASKASVAAALELFARISDDRPDLSAVVTVSGPLSEGRHPACPNCVITAAPEENPAVLHRFFTHWDPGCLIWIGGAFHPLLLHMAQERRIPSISTDTTRVSATVQHHAALPGLRSHTLRCFDTAFTADHNAMVPWRTAKLDAERIEPLGFLEEGGMVPVCDEEQLGDLSETIGTRPIWYAAQVDSAELETILAVHRHALRRAHRLLLILSVAKNTDEAIGHCRDAGLIAEAFQEGAPVSEATQVIVTCADPREALWYRLASVCFLGGSFEDRGGIDPYPAASMGSAIVHGPNIGNFASIYKRLNAANAAWRVRDGKELGEALQNLLSPDQAASLAQAAWEITTTGAEVTDRVADLAQDFLDLRDRLGP